MMGKLLLIVGLSLAALGALLHWAPGALSWFGRLPGDLRIERDWGGVYIPFTSMLILSLALTILLNLFFRR
ncbi:MAG: DUF2905 domain-containing protein [Wenzhouxiangellaceae bacterium]